MTHTAELLPCPNPWCDRPNGLRCRHLVDGWHVFCRCNLVGPKGETEAEEIAAWNTRTDAQLRADRDALLEWADNAVGWLEQVRDEGTYVHGAVIKQGNDIISRIRGEGE